jgi:hypothetical protein
MKELHALELELNSCRCPTKATMLRAKIKAIEAEMRGKTFTIHKAKADYPYKRLF